MRQALLLLPTITGCLWIPDGAHQRRTDGLEFRVREVAFEPVGLSECRPTQRTLIVTIRLGHPPERDRRADDAPYAVRAQLGDAPVQRIDALAPTGGALELAVDAAPAVRAPDCADGCTLPLSLVVSRLGVEQQARICLLYTSDAADEL